MNKNQVQGVTVESYETQTSLSGLKTYWKNGTQHRNGSGRSCVLTSDDVDKQAIWNSDRCPFVSFSGCQLGQMLPSLNCWCLLLNSNKQMSVKPKTHLQITYWSADPVMYAFIPMSSLRDLHQSGKKEHITHIYGNYLRELLPCCSGLSAGAMQTQAMMAPAAA